MKEYWLGHHIVGFDGFVLELFGVSEVRRYHVHHLQSFELRQRRRGGLSLFIAAQGVGGGISLNLDASARNQLDELVNAVNAARHARGLPPVPREP